MIDTYEFLKAQKDAILAKREAEKHKWLDAALADIAHYRKRAQDAEATFEHDTLIIRTAEEKIEKLLAENAKLVCALESLAEWCENMGYESNELDAARAALGEQT